MNIEEIVDALVALIMNKPIAKQMKLNEAEARQLLTMYVDGLLSDEVLSRHVGTVRNNPEEVRKRRRERVGAARMEGSL